MTADAPAIVLVGPMGVGKSSIGRRVAKALGVPFTDTDAVIVREHGAISAIFDEHGEPYFRALERDAVHEALGRPGVLALGGGAAMHPATRAAPAPPPRVPRTAAARLRDASRPLLRGSGVEEWARIYAARKPIYEEVATVTFDTSHGPLQAVVGAIVAWSKENPR